MSKFYNALDRAFSNIYTFSIGILIFIIISLPTPVFSAEFSCSWESNTEKDLEGYGIYFTKNISGPPYNLFGYIPIDTLADPMNPIFTLTGLENGSKYYVAVTAYNAGGIESAFSNSICVQVGVKSIPCSDSVSGNNGETGNQEGGGGGGGCFINAIRP